MRTLAIGDVQGCYDPLRRLLDRAGFDPAADRLWLAGDLVNRGPQSLEVLRFVRALGGAAVTVLGNHDLHLLAAAHGGRVRPKDRLDDVLRAPDRDELLDWLRRRPLLHEDRAAGRMLVHAGLPPQWDRAQAAALAREVEAWLHGPDYGDFLAQMYGDEPDVWREGLAPVERARFVINAMTRLRYCDRQGRLHLRYKEPAPRAGSDLVPWFQAPGRRTRGTTIVFGHWSTLGRIAWRRDSVYCVDTGCVWGRSLTALDVATGAVVKTRCKAYSPPGAD